jgi:hypothetical protein
VTALKRVDFPTFGRPTIPALSIAGGDWAGWGAWAREIFQSLDSFRIGASEGGEKELQNSQDFPIDTPQPTA